MKYTFHYKVLIFCTFILAYASVESILEHLPTLAAVFIGITFFLLMGVLAAPDSEKYVKK